jgi:hypothetical protein
MINTPPEIGIRPGCLGQSVNKHDTNGIDLFMDSMESETSKFVRLGKRDRGVWEEDPFRRKSGNSKQRA